MRDNSLFYINGAWVAAEGGNTFDVIDPATGQVSGIIGSGTSSDVDRAVSAAKAAFASYRETTVMERLALLDRIIDAYKSRQADMGLAIRTEMGAPAWLADGFQRLLGLVQYEETRKAL
jgi:aldehyde dehydrogenase (NAD+)